MAAALLVGATSCQSEKTADSQSIIERPDINVSDGCYTDTVL